MKKGNIVICNGIVKGKQQKRAVMRAVPVSEAAGASPLVVRLQPPVRSVARGLRSRNSPSAQTTSPHPCGTAPRGGTVPGGRMAEREGTAAAVPERLPQGRSVLFEREGRVARFERRGGHAAVERAAGDCMAPPAAARTRTRSTVGNTSQTAARPWIDTRQPAVDDAGHAQACLGLPETVRPRRGARGAPVDARVAPRDRLRVRALPEPRRVLRRGDGDLPDPRGGLHAPLRLLRDRQGVARAARPGRAGGGRRGRSTSRAGLRRRDLGDPRRPRGRRRGPVRRDDPRHPARGACRAETRRRGPVPDFAGAPGALETVLAAGPAVLNHNLETVPRLYPRVRPGADYARSLALLRRSREIAPAIPTKSGLMVGLGEQVDEVVAVMRDLAAAGVSVADDRPVPAAGPGEPPRGALLAPGGVRRARGGRPRGGDRAGDGGAAGAQLVPGAGGVSPRAGPRVSRQPAASHPASPRRRTKSRRAQGPACHGDPCRIQAISCRCSGILPR